MAREFRYELDPRFVTVDEWSSDWNRLLKCHAKMESEVLGLAVFDILVATYPGNYLTLRNRTRVIRKHEPPRSA